MTIHHVQVTCRGTDRLDSDALLAATDHLGRRDTLVAQLLDGSGAPGAMLTIDADTSTAALERATAAFPNALCHLVQR